MQAFARCGVAALASAILCVLPAFAGQGCPAVTGSIANENAAAVSWIAYSNGLPRPTVFLSQSSIPAREVAAAKIGGAVVFLKTATTVQLTRQQAATLAGSAPQGIHARTPYLLRGVGAAWYTGAINVTESRNADVWVEFGALSHCDIPMKRRPVVAWLDRSPPHVYVTFSVAE